MAAAYRKAAEMRSFEGSGEGAAGAATAHHGTHQAEATDHHRPAGGLGHRCTAIVAAADRMMRDGGADDQVRRDEGVIVIILVAAIIAEGRVLEAEEDAARYADP